MASSFDADAFREFERQGHDRLADSYTDLFTPITGLAIDSLLDAGRIEAGSKVLDVASGPGLVCGAVRDPGGHPTGVDLSSRMVERARQLYPGIAFQVGDVERLPLADASFNAVVSNFGLGHFPRPEASVVECVRVLRPGGMLAFSWWDTLEKQRLQAIFREAITASGAKPGPSIPTGHDVFRFSNTQARPA